MKRVVLDTNVTIAAFFWKGHPRAVYDLIRDRKFVMLLSNDMEKEFISGFLVIRNSDFLQKKFLLSLEILEAMQSLLKQRAGFL